MSRLFSRCRNALKILYILTILISEIVLFPYKSTAYMDLSANQKLKDDEIKKIETELEKEREQLLRFHEKEKQLLKELANLEKKVEEKKQVLVILREKINSNKADLEKVKFGLHDLEIAQREIQKRLDLRLIAFYKNAKRGYLHLLTRSTEFDQLQKWTKYFKVIVNEDQKLLKEMNLLQIKKRQDLALMNEKLAAINSLERSESESLSSLTQDNENKVLILMKIHKEKEFYATAVTELEAAAKKLKETIVVLDQQELKLPQSSSFVTAKGRLSAPIEGRLVEIENEAEDRFNKVYKGIYIEGLSGSEVRAIYDGKIDYSGFLKGYGQIIVINHGSRFFTVSAHLGKRFKEKGDLVKKGENIGLLENGESTIRPKLYFEIRHGGTNLNPLEWLKLH